MLTPKVTPLPCSQVRRQLSEDLCCWCAIGRQQVVTSKWIYKIKHAANGSIEKYKRFVAHGFSQKKGIDYEETFAPVARYTSIRLVLALVAVMKWKIHQLDVNTDFLNGVLEEEVYVE